MFEIHREQLDWAGRKLVLETGRIARQADGAVLAVLGRDHRARHRRFRQGAEGRRRLLPADRQLPGKGLRRRPHPRRLLQARRPPAREGDARLPPDRPSRSARSSRTATATTRRSIVTVLSHDLENDPDILSMVAVSAALTLSGIPFMGPIGAARVGYINGELKLNPTIDEMKESRARPRRRRHAGRRADGRVRSAGAFGRDDARSGDDRSSRLPAGDRRDHPPRREGRQGAARSRRRRQVGHREGRVATSPKPNCAKPTRSPSSRSATPPSTP